MTTDIEIREPAVEILACTNPFTTEKTRLVVPGGETITEIFARLEIPPWVDAWVEIDGWRVPRHLWAHTRPKRGRQVVIRVLPHQSGGGNDDNKTLRMVLSIVIIIVAIVLVVVTWG